jgi:hypothetical protein
VGDLQQRTCIALVGDTQSAFDKVMLNGFLPFVVSLSNHGVVGRAD